MQLDTIQNIDCMIGLKDIPDESIDMILTDLPYGTTQNKWDKVIPLEPLFAELNRVVKEHGAMCFLCQQPFETDLINANRKYFRYEWVWDKHLATGALNANRMPLKVHENVAVFYKHLPTYNPQFTQGKPYTRLNCDGRAWGENYASGTKPSDVFNDGKRYPKDIISFTQITPHFGHKSIDKIHPTQKPVELCEYMIKTYSNENDIVLDVCMGSGTTAHACINTNRHFVGFETDKTYFDKSIERLERASEAIHPKAQAGTKGAI